MEIENINILDIIIGTRFRSDLGDISELETSIVTNGLIQPITIDGDNTLIAGGRRLMACANLGWETIPVIRRTVSGECNLRELELVENIHRKDLEWHERDALVAAIHEMYVAQVGEDNWSVRRTSIKLGVSSGSVMRHIEMAKALEQVPALKKAANQDQAVKTLKKLHEHAAIKEIKAQHDLGDGGNLCPRARAAAGNYIVGDSLAGMKEIEGPTVIGFIEIDPPYAIDLKAVKQQATDAKNPELDDYNEVDAEDYPEFMTTVIRESYRLAGNNCWMILWHGMQWKDLMYKTAILEGWEIDPIPAIWSKGSGQTMQPNINLARTYESFLVCRKGKPVLAKPGRSNVFTYAPEKPSKKYHPTQRPITLMIDIIETFSFERSVIMIPFLGSGSTLRAAYKTGRTGFGWDLSESSKGQFLLAVDNDLTAEKAE